MGNKRAGRRLLIVLAALVLLVPGCGGTSLPTLTVGTTNFTENLILGQIYAQAIAARGYPVELRSNLGSREVAFPALRDGEVDLLPEYTGNALRYLREDEPVELRDEQEVYRALQRELDEGLIALDPARAQNVDGLVVTRQTAKEHDLQKVSDIAHFPGTFRFGGGPECPQRPSCLSGYREVYGFDEEEFEFVELDVAGPGTVQALNSGRVDGASLFTTQGVIASEGYVMLEDDRDMQLPQQIVPIGRQDALDAHESWLRELINAVSSELTTGRLIELNRQVEVEHQRPEAVARQWVTDHGFAAQSAG